ncbi:hypothetical protein pb186bvf_004188 [Paramecium bursaria]
MQKILIALLLVQIAFSAQADTRKAVESFLDGFFKASGFYDTVPKATVCHNELIGTKPTVVDAISKIKTGQFTKVLDGIAELTKQVSDVATDCGENAKEVVALTQQVYATVTDRSFLFSIFPKIVANGQRFINDVEQEVQADQAKDFYNEGFYAGDIVKIILSK